MGEGGSEILAQIHADIAAMRGHMSDMKVIQARQAVLLEEHIRRTDLAEERIATAEERLRPLETHVAAWGQLGKLLVVLATGAGLLYTVLKILGG